MKKIIKHGNNKIFECSKCGCIFIATSNDWIKDTVLDEEGYYRQKIRSNCPECNAIVFGKNIDRVKINDYFDF